MKGRGRPRTSNVDRTEQLRLAKRAQRARQRAAGIVSVELALPAPLAAKLAVARRSRDFTRLLERTLDAAVIRLADYPQLRDLAWNRTDELIGAKEAFQLYERNWRFIEPGRLDERERALIARLKSEFGGGEING
jgi:hypothetical protein